MMQRKRENEKTRRRAEFNAMPPQRKDAKNTRKQVDRETRRFTLPLSRYPVIPFSILRHCVIASLRFFPYRYPVFWFSSFLTLFSSAFSASLRFISSRFPTFPLSHFPTFCILVTLCCHTLAHGAEKYAGDFLTLGVGARPLGMGGSFAAIADDSTAAYWNPAGLGRLRHSEAAFMHSSLGELDSYDFVNYVHPIGGAASLGLSWLRVGIDDIPITTLPRPASPVSPANRPRQVGTFSSTDNAFFLSYGRQIGVNLGSKRLNMFLGGNAKLIYITALEQHKRAWRRGRSGLALDNPY